MGPFGSICTILTHWPPALYTHIFVVLASENSENRAFRARVRVHSGPGGRDRPAVSSITKKSAIKSVNYSLICAKTSVRA